MKNVERLFSCKDEELIPIGKRTLFSLKRDLAEFTAYSPLINEQYVTDTDAMISAAEELLAPQAETLAMSLITNRLTTTMNGLQPILNKLEGYLKLTAKMSGITASGFGISALRTAVNTKDAEAVVKKLDIVLLNVRTYKDVLTGAGLSQEMVDSLDAVMKSVDTDRQEQYEILTRRKNLVQTNCSVLNDLFKRIAEIHAIGKALYKGVDPAKLTEYTFTQLLTKVRQVSKAKEPAETTVQNAGTVK